MTTAIWSRRAFSIATDGLDAITGNAFTTIMGDVVMELISAPIQPGRYTIRLTALMGGIRIFLPAYAKVELDGASFWGGKHLHQTSTFWQQMEEAFARSNIHLPLAPTPWADTTYAENPVTLRFTINALLGGANLYQPAQPSHS